MKSFLIAVSLLLFSSCLKAQSSTDAHFLFKMWLFVDRQNTEGVLKSDSLFNKFCSMIELKLDKVKSNQFNLDIEYYYLKLYDRNSNKLLNNVSFKRDLNADEWQCFLIPVNKYIGHYVIALDIKTGKSYRLAGFNGNDFLGFLTDFKEEYEHLNSRKLSTKNFLKQYHIEGLDFECLYDGLLDAQIHRDKYPCLIRSSDPVSIH